MRSLNPVVLDTLANCLTFVTTYTCTASCEQCCFGCTPESEGRLSLNQMKQAITEAHSSLPSLQLVAFTGGECFLLKEDLFEAIAFASSRGLMTRCVSNGSWGKTKRAAQRIAHRCKEAGLTEINFSTGEDHIKFVPFQSVMNASEAALDLGMTVLVTIEQDSPSTSRVAKLIESPQVKRLLESAPSRFLLQVNAWMPFTSEDERRRSPDQSCDGPCEQVFSNVVITPHGQVSACCGLTYEHIPEMILGTLSERPLRETYASQLDDLVKVWLRVEGPAGVARGLLPAQEADALLRKCNHICELCARVHQHDAIRSAPISAWATHTSRLMNAFGSSLLSRVAEEASASLRPAGTTAFESTNEVAVAT